MSKLADIFRPKALEAADEADHEASGVIVPMPRVSVKANGARQMAAGHQDRERDDGRGDEHTDAGDMDAGTNAEADAADRADSNVETLPEAVFQRGVGLQRSEESEALHKLLTDTRRKIDDLDTLKGALNDMALPFRGAMRALDQERALSNHLSRQLSEKAAVCDDLRDALQQAETRTRQVETEAESLRDVADQARESGRTAESSQAALADEIKRRDAKINALERLLDQEIAQRRGLSESCRTLQEQAFQSENRIAELQDALTAAGQACEALKQDKRSLWRSAEQAREEAERLGRRLAEGEGVLSAIRVELGKVEARYTEVCAERSRLADIVDDLQEQHGAERQRLNSRLEALETRAAAAERLAAETRQRLIERTEEARSFICKTAEATIARSAAERRLASLQTSKGLRPDSEEDPTESRTALSEYLRALNVRSREMAMASATEKLAARSERQGQAAAGSTSRQAGTDKQPKPFVEGLPVGRARPSAVEDALAAARKADARLETEVASLRAGLGRAGEPPSGGAGIARPDTLAYKAGLVAQLRRPPEKDDPPRSVA